VAYKTSAVTGGPVTAVDPGAPHNPLQQRHVRPLRSVHNVKPGETLPQIAAMYGMGSNELIQLNSHAVGGGGIVHPGMRLQV
jgi:LysM repeat protein